VANDNVADHVGEVLGLLEQVDCEIASFITDGASDGEPVNKMVACQQHNIIHDAGIVSTGTMVPQVTAKSAGDLQTLSAGR
jgi:hypothetical protein